MTLHQILAWVSCFFSWNGPEIEQSSIYMEITSIAGDEFFGSVFVKEVLKRFAEYTGATIAKSYKL